MLTKNRVCDDVVVADENWIEEDFDEEDEDVDETASVLARNMPWNALSASPLKDPGHTTFKSARRSLDLEDVKPYDNMYSKHGGVIPDQNWIDAQVVDILVDEPVWDQGPKRLRDAEDEAGPGGSGGP